jgi:hypothetical protein
VFIRSLGKATLFYTILQGVRYAVGAREEIGKLGVICKYMTRLTWFRAETRGDWSAERVG